MNGRPVAVRLTQLSRHFGEVKALNSIDLDVYDGEFFSMLGPSGSGKTTCLRLIAGFEQPTSGSIELNGQQVAGVPPYERDINTVFQDYALFPHMTVADNIAYGLMVKRMPKAQRITRVDEMLAMVRLPGFGGRKPSQLSGGQRQRVALARALINHPKVLLLDEPLGALDLKLRQEMQVELKTIQREVGITFIFVTHDQEEAMTMSDRIAVFNHGKIEQVGTPYEMYENPQTRFVAQFIGTTNVLEGPIAQQIVGSPAPFAVRPERIALCPPDTAIPPDNIGVRGMITDVTYLGMTIRWIIDIAGTLVTVIEPSAQLHANALDERRGQPCMLVWQKAHNRALKEA